MVAISLIKDFDVCFCSKFIIKIYHTELCFTLFFQVDENDGLPSKICLQCVNQISSAYTFKQRCEESDATFRKLVQKNNALQESSIKKETQSTTNSVEQFEDYAVKSELMDEVKQFDDFSNKSDDDVDDDDDDDDEDWNASSMYYLVYHYSTFCNFNFNID